jgi:hypothetical protein
MTSDTERSEAVVDDYKKHKLAGSALRRIQEIVHGFDQERATDIRLARIGIVIILLLLGLAVYFLFGLETRTLS